MSGVDNPVLILDEPTTVLTSDEIERLFEILRELKRECSIIFISHRLEEVLELSTSGIRNDHVRVMQAEESKHADQLEYRLVIADSLLENIIHGMDGDYVIKRYVSWETVTKI